MGIAVQYLAQVLIKEKLLNAATVTYCNTKENASNYLALNLDGLCDKACYSYV